MAIGIGNGICFKQGFDFASYWAQQSSLLYTDRSGDELIEKSGRNAKIIGCPVMDFEVLATKGVVLGIADNGAFDITVTNELSLSCWVRITTDADTLTYIAGKNIAGNTSGRYGLTYSTDNKFSAGAYDTAAEAIAADSTFSLNTWYHLIMTVKENDKLNLYINNSLQGAGAVVGTFSALANQFEFLVGAGNNSTGSGVQRPFTGNIYDVRIFDHVLTPAERASVYAGDIVGNEIGFFPLHDYYNTMGNASARWFDISGNGRHLSSMGDSITNQWNFTDNSGFYCLNNGFSVWGRPLHATNYDNFVCVPYRMSGIPLSMVVGTTVPAGYEKLIDVPGNLTKLNSFPCLFDFDPNDTHASVLDVFDRSNATIHNDTSRASAYYDASNPYRYGSLELNINILKTFFETAHLWRVFPKMSSNGVYRDERNYFDSIAAFPAQLSTSQKTGILKYTGDYDLFYSMVYTELTTTHISIQRGNTIIYCDDAGTLSISINGGATILRTLDVSSDLSKLTFAYIWANGNINFGYGDAMYLSTDNLQTYSAIVVSDITGNPYSSVKVEPFNSLVPTDYINYNGQELLLFGCYSTEAGVENTDINIWFSDDNGATLRSIYKFGVSLPLAQARHVHGVHFNPDNNEFWIITGDDTYLGDDECHWIKGTYNGSAFTWTIIVSDDGAETGTYVKAAGMHFYDGYCYFGLDKTGSTVGIWKCLYADMGDNTKYEQLTGYSSSLGMAGGNAEMMWCQGVPAANMNTLAVSVDAKHFQFETYTITGFVVANNYNKMGSAKATPENYVLDFLVAGETIYTEGPQLSVRINKNN